MKRILATYLIETPYSLHRAAEVMAGEQSTGTFIKLPGETDEIRKNHAAVIENIEELEIVDSPSLPGSKVLGHHQYNRGVVTLSFPYHNIGPSIPNLLATIAGNLYELEEFSGLRLIDLNLPKDFMDVYHGPTFGIKGTRELTGIFDRPIIGTIIKPNIGMSPEELRQMVRELALQGIDFIKDDEINGNPPYFPLQERVKVVMEEINRAADKTGKKVMYAFNITDDIEHLKRNHDLVVEHGGNCIMVSVNSIGFTGVHYLAQYSDVPIHGHRNQWGMLTRCPYLGMDFKVYQKLCRLAGVDHLHVNGLDNKFFESNQSVIESAKACLTPMFGNDTCMPVLSSKQWAGSAPITYQALETIDVIHLAGGGIHAHPAGSKAGFNSMIQGWEAALKGIPLEEYAKSNHELAQSLATFNQKKTVGDVNENK